MLAGERGRITGLRSTDGAKHPLSFASSHHAVDVDRTSLSRRAIERLPVTVPRFASPQKALVRSKSIAGDQGHTGWLGSSGKSRSALGLRI